MRLGDLANRIAARLMAVREEMSSGAIERRSTAKSGDASAAQDATAPRDEGGPAFGEPGQPRDVRVFGSKHRAAEMGMDGPAAVQCSQPDAGDSERYVCQRDDCPVCTWGDAVVFETGDQLAGQAPPLRAEAHPMPNCIASLVGVWSAKRGTTRERCFETPGGSRTGPDCTCLVVRLPLVNFVIASDRATAIRRAAGPVSTMEPHAGPAGPLGEV
jgi:hypothetical protein